MSIKISSEAFERVINMKDGSAQFTAAALWAGLHAPILFNTIAELQERGAFLLCRIDELDWSQTRGEIENDFHGHVTPAIASFRAAIEGATS